MTDEPKHSPLPFKYIEESSDKEGEEPMEWWILDAESELVAEIHSCPNDGKLFVRRVNEGPAVDKKLAIAEEMAKTIIEVIGDWSAALVGPKLTTATRIRITAKAREFLKAHKG